MKNHTSLALIVLASLALDAGATSVSYNTGSLGAAGNGTNTDTVVLDQPGALAAGGDFSTGYIGALGCTTVPFLTPLNPATSQPFTIEFWAKPNTTTNDDVPVNNRVGGSGNRSGWVFFQRAAGWNFRMYSGAGTAAGPDPVGGTSTLGVWSHVVATWDGTTARLYVNGTFATSATGTYAASSAAVFSVGALADGASDFNGLVDEIAFYPTALSDAKILAHYNTASSPVSGAYSSLVLSDGALEYLQQNPPFVKIAMSGVNQVVTFTGILSKSTDLTPASWEDLAVTSPYTVTPTAETPKLFFRAHR
ncbi:MAG: LamG domain-containing protein [Verrucomicrobiota bacterium]